RTAKIKVTRFRLWGLPKRSWAFELPAPHHGTAPRNGYMTKLFAAAAALSLAFSAGAALAQEDPAAPAPAAEAAGPEAAPSTEAAPAASAEPAADDASTTTEAAPADD